MRADAALGGGDRDVRGAIDFALAALLKAQYPTGAWAQRFEAPPDAARFPVLQASYPESWPREWPNRDYRSYYTFNDNNLERMAVTLLDAAEEYRRDDCRAAVRRIGEFILLARMPEPQPAWAQQYDAAMHPAWARRFEPPAVTGGESQGVMRTLLLLYRETADRRLLEPLPAALDYLRRSRLQDGRLARFYELRTNRPLYFTRDYRLTESDADVPTHYAFKVSDGTPAIRREYERLRDAPAKALKADRPAPRRVPGADAVRAVIAALDERGRWVEDGRLRYHGPDDPTRRVVRSDTFIRNAGVLCDYLASRRAQER
jgi:hypothetical protein